MHDTFFYIYIDVRKDILAIPPGTVVVKKNPMDGGRKWPNNGHEIA